MCPAIEPDEEPARPRHGLSRRAKNSILFGVLWLNAFVTLFVSRSEDPPSTYEALWLVGLLVVSLWTLVASRLAVTLRHALLFLLVGGAVAGSVQQVLLDERSPSVFEVVVLLLLVAAVAVHYSPSRDDPYL